MDHEGHAKIGDFGLVKPDMNINEFTYSFCGSAEYMPPEMLLKCGHSYPVDYYCLGALLYEVTLSILINYKLVTGLPPFYSINNDEICERVLTEELMFPSHAFNLSVDLKDLIRGLLKKNPYERMGNQGGIKEILSHPWFEKINIKDMLEKKIQPPIKPDIL